MKFDKIAFRKVFWFRKFDEKYHRIKRNNSKWIFIAFFEKKSQNVKNFTRQNFGLSRFFLERDVTTKRIASHLKRQLKSKKDSNHVPMSQCALLTVRVRQNIFQKSNFISIFSISAEFAVGTAVTSMLRQSIDHDRLFFYIEIEFDRDFVFRQFYFFLHFSFDFYFFQKKKTDTEQKKSKIKKRKLHFSKMPTHFEKANETRRKNSETNVEYASNERKKNDFSKCKHCSEIQ